MQIRFLRAVLGSLFFFLGNTASYAVGTLQLETSVVIVNTGEQEGTLAVRNTADMPLLMITKVEPILEGSQDLLLVNPPITRVEPGDTQIVRFLLKPRGEGQPEIKTEQLMRVSFEGVPPKENNKVNFSIRQNIPVIIHPGGLAKADSPWQSLTWQREGDELVVKNPTSYVIRFTPALILLPSGTAATLPRTYILPGEAVRASVKSVPPGDDHVRMHPKSQYGYVVGAYDGPLTSAAALATGK